MRQTDPSVPVAEKVVHPDFVATVLFYKVGIMKKVSATIALLLIGVFWYAIGNDAGYTMIGVVIFGVAVSLVALLWSKRYAQSTKRIIIGLITLSVIAVILFY